MSKIILLKNINLRILGIVVMIMLSFNSLTYANPKSDYVLGEGQKDQKRLDMQNEIFQTKLTNAFKKAKSIKQPR